MKRIKLTRSAVFMVLLLCVATVISSCSKDDETIPQRTLDQYIQDLNQFITSEKAVVSACVVGYNKGDFKVASSKNFTSYTTGYIKVLDAALPLVTKPNVTISEIIKAHQTFSKPGELFLTNVFISDRRLLNDIIVPCEALHTATLVGTGTGKVSQEAKTAFTAAITSAKTSRDASTTIARQVAEAVKKLDEAKKVFEAAIGK